MASKEIVNLQDIETGKIYAVAVTPEEQVRLESGKFHAV